MSLEHIDQIVTCKNKIPNEFPQLQNVNTKQARQKFQTDYETLIDIIYLFKKQNALTTQESYQQNNHIFFKENDDFALQVDFNQDNTRTFKLMRFNCEAILADIQDFKRLAVELSVSSYYFSEELKFHDQKAYCKFVENALVEKASDEYEMAIDESEDNQTPNPENLEQENLSVLNIDTLVISEGPDNENSELEFVDNNQLGKRLKIASNENDSIYIGTMLKDKYQGYGHYIFSKEDEENRKEYEGNWVDGLMHGDGRLLYKNGDEFTGKFENGKKNGQGIFIYENGNKCKGQFKDNQQNGHGELIIKLSNHSQENCQSDVEFKYTGELVDDKPHGEGELITPLSSYKGHFVEGHKNGVGELYRLDPEGNQEYYKGQFKDNKFNGVGRLEHTNKDVYFGEFRYGAFNGEGKYTWNKSGDEYTGTFVNGKRQGKGELQMWNGDRYIGNWESEKKHGDGHFIYADGREFIGKFYKNRKLSKQGIYQNPDGTKYIGTWL